VIGDSGARIQIRADYERLEFLRVLRYRPSTEIDTPGGLVIPNENVTAAPQAEPAE
jgi:rod shape-determining protein MreC